MELANAYATATDLPPLSPQDAPLDDLQFTDEEFTEADVLPFLLQAQDIIAKLESRVVELETDLSSIHRKYEHDRHDWLVGLSQKDQFIHHLSSKLQKQEFNGKQAIVLLNDCISNTTGEGDIDVTSTLSLCLSYLRNTGNKTTNMGDEEDFELEEGELERRQAAANEWKQCPPAPSLSTSTTWQPVNLMDGLDSPSHGNSIDGSDSSRVDTDSSATNILHAINNDDVLSSNTSISSMTRIQSEDSAAMNSTTPATTVTAINDNDDDDLRLHPHQHQHQQHRPLSSRPQLMTTTPASMDHCANCRQLLTQLDQQIEQKAYLKRDLGALASALAEEEQVRESVEQSRLDLVDDIQEITTSLFGSLNQVVMDEVTEREGLLRLNRELDGALVNVLQSWDVRDQRLKEMKELLVDLDASAHQTATTERPLALGQGVDECGPASHLSLYQPTRHTHTLSSLSGALLDETLSLSSSSYDKTTIRLDGVNFREFQGHLKALTNSISSSKASPSSATTTAKATSASGNQYLPSSPFMKRVVAEDVEPCLFQNNGTSWWKSPWFKRKLMDAIANNNCEIQHAVRPVPHSAGMTTQTTTTLSSSSTSSSCTLPSVASIDMPMPPKTKCTCCGLLRVCEFKMRLHLPTAATTTSTTSSFMSKMTLQKQQQQQQQQQQQPWLPIDRFCRDRLVAVCDFYGFLSHLPQAVTQNTPVLVMFKQSLIFRRKMAMAKVGSVALFTSSSSSSSPSAAGDYNLMEGLRSASWRQSTSVKRRSRSSKRESIVLDHSGNGSDTGSVVSLSDIQGLDGTSQIMIVH
ncbi:hypothetical protein BCR42DRAFT_205427 [Absidia repens]|uniref:GDP/GTP exchange factor Sec2 N-terminal domain-containing protein n=1 Tax=Absidia repens TaxID=90262 RepID=A0A1X2IPU8_9FUNG|nr:hypothetical protein BCR42DRAFT_205427 [Absidia repens]